MDNLFWKPEYSVGVDEIDRHHQRLFDMIGLLQLSLDSKLDDDSTITVLDEMVDYVNYHFQREEELMTKYEYPHFKDHKKEHWEFALEAMEFVRKYHENKNALTVEMHNYLKEWLINHILNSDQQYAKFFQQKGINAELAEDPDNN